MAVSSTRYVRGEEIRLDKPDSKLKQASAATKRTSKARKSTQECSHSSSKTSDDTAAPTCFSWLLCMLCVLFLIPLSGVCGTGCSVIFNKANHSHVDVSVSDSANKLIDSAANGFMKYDSLNGLPR